MQSFRRHCGKFVSRIVKDFRQKELLPLKLLFFVHASSLLVLYPYMTIHMRELGINVEETAIMSAVTPVVAIVMPPLAGMVADKIGNFKLLLSSFSILGGLSALLLLLVPVGRITVTYPDEVMMTVGCGGFNNSGLDHSSLEITLAGDLPCNMSSRFLEPGIDLNSRMESCGFMCRSLQTPKEKFDVPEAFRPGSSEEDDQELSVDSILKARSYSINELNLDTKQQTTHFYNLTQEDVSHKHTKQEALSERFMKNNPNFQTAIRRFSQNQYFLPTKDLNELSCSLAEEESVESSDFLLSSARFSRTKRQTSAPAYNCFFGHSESSPTDLVATEGININNRLENTANNTSYKAETMNWNSTTISPTCQIDTSREWSATVFLHNPTNNVEVVHEINLDKCQPRCLMTSKRLDVCSNLKKNIAYSPSLTFWTYLAVRVFIGMIGGTAFAMFEGAVIAILREQKADYGLQRIYASIGGMISSPLSGILIDWASYGKGYTDFRPAFYLYASLKVFGGILMLLINLEFKSGADNVVSDVIAVLKKIEVIALLVACFILGSSWGYIESFLFWLLQDLGGNRSLMGITITVGGVAGIPLLALSGPIIHKFGHANVIFMGFVFYAVRLLGYSLIYNPWHCLFFEAMESITTSLAFTAAVTYAAKLSTSTTDSSIQGLLGGIYFGVGKGAGSLVGGYLMGPFGTRTTFQIFAVFTAIMGCVYYFFNKFYLEKLPQSEGNEICKKAPKTIKASHIAPLEVKPRDTIKKNGEFIGNNNEKAISMSDQYSHDNPAFIQTEEDKTEETPIEDKGSNNDNIENDATNQTTNK